MANDNATAGDLNYADTLWKAADALRAQVDADEDKHVILGLLFLKYISDSFESRRDDLRVEMDGLIDLIAGIGVKRSRGKARDKLKSCKDDMIIAQGKGESSSRRPGYAPPIIHSLQFGAVVCERSELQSLTPEMPATRPDIATLIDDVILAVERDNPNLKSKLPRDYARRGIDPVKMKGLLAIRVPIPQRGNGRQPNGCRRKKASAPSGYLGSKPSISPPNPESGCGIRCSRRPKPACNVPTRPETRRLAHMNLAIHGIEAKLGEQPADTFLRDQHPDLEADFVLPNPPFNVSDWSGQLLRGDKRWTYGDPPVGNCGRVCRFNFRAERPAIRSLSAPVQSVATKASKRRDQDPIGWNPDLNDGRAPQHPSLDDRRGAPQAPEHQVGRGSRQEPTRQPLGRSPRQRTPSHPGGQIGCSHAYTTDMKKYVLILANSIKHNPHRCVAGREIVKEGNEDQWGPWVRPVTTHDEGALSPQERRYADSSELKPLDLVEVEIADHQNDPIQPENWMLGSPPAWAKIDDATFPALKGAVEQPQNLWLDGSTKADRATPAFLAAQAEKRSLYLIEPNHLHVVVETHSWEGRS